MAGKKKKEILRTRQYQDGSQQYTKPGYIHKWPEGAESRESIKQGIAAGVSPARQGKLDAKSYITSLNPERGALNKRKSRKKK